MKSAFYIIFINLLNLYFSSNLYCASCCGGGSSSSVIISEDNLQELTIGYALRSDIGQSDNLGFTSIHENAIKDQQYFYNLQFARMIFDRFQVSAKIGVTTKDIIRQHRIESISGLQDIEIQSSYEILPEYTYSIFKPRGFSYLKVSFPMSKSLYDSNSPVFADVRGSGLYSFASGVFFLKKLSNISLKSAFEYQYYLGRQYNETKLKDYYKLVIPFGLSHPLDQFPIILSATSTWNFQSKKKVEGNIQAISQSEYFWDLNFSSSFRLSDQSNLTLSYSDSSLVGKSINSPLYRMMALNYNYGWPL